MADTSPHVLNADDDFSPGELAAIERMTREIGGEIFAALGDGGPNIFERRWWDDRIMAWAMQDESVKLQMFRFVDVLPMLGSAADVTRHLHEYFDEVRQFLPSAVRLGLAAAAPNTVLGRAMAIAARRQASAQARRFIAGTTSDEVLAAAMRERKLRRAFTIDVLGEAVTSQTEADRYLQTYIDLIESIAPRANDWPEVPQVDRGQFMPMPRMNLSVKLSSLDSQFDAIDSEGSFEHVAGRLRQLLRVAQRNGAYVHVDMESYATKDLTLAIFMRVLAEDEFRQTSDVGTVIQCYLRDSLDDLVRLRDWARQRGKPIWVRLVKGAYWDYETVHAQAVGWPIPVFTEKWQSDACFERAIRFVMRNVEYLRPALGSHNIRSLAHGIATARQVGLPPSGFEIQMLYGMADAEKQLFVDRGHRVRIYMPYGELIPGMAYLVRRLLENTSNDSFLRASFTEHIAAEKLLMNPSERGPIEFDAPPPRVAVSVKGENPPPQYANEPPTDFAVAENRNAMRAALEKVRGQLGAHWPLMIGGRAVETAEKLTSTDPGQTDRIVGTTGSASRADAEQAVAAARAAVPSWAALPASERGVFLLRAADVISQRRFEFAAWEVYECGKPWREADGDVCEAIDFLRYYSQAAVQMENGRGVDVPGEENRFVYAPRGVAAVIAPWNFPLAILTGLSSAALATGNTVVMKPAEQSPVIAALFYQVLAEAGLPAGALNYLPGLGETAGAALVEHPDVALVAFTGSREVGMAIHRRAAEVSASGAPRVKRVIAEMGGKNAIIVDADADLDEAVLGVAHSAFGYQGQKCSACSRAVVLDAVHDAFLARLIEAARSLPVGQAEDPGTVVGPLIDEEARQRVERYIETGCSEGRCVLSVDVGEMANQGHFVGPHIFAEIAPDARLAQEEIFGPVLAVIRAADYDDALRIANSTDYALTGGVFSRSPAHLDRARREMQVGNLYLNRAITGALVGRQPFGGFRLSGIGSQAGGPDYLLQFVVPRTITENTLRRGFAPSTESDDPAENST